jgi:hypothetical protein
MANTKITTGNIADGSITSAKLDTSSLAIPSTATATTQTAGDNSTAIATTAYVETAVSNLVDSSPAALDTLNELAAALGDDANFSTTVTNSLALKAPLASPSFTGNVGIGTSSPSTKLDISVVGGMARVGGAAGNNLLQAYTGSVGAGIWAGGQTRLYSTGSMTLSTGATLTTSAPTGYTDAVTIDSSGNVGIGTTATIANSILNVEGGINSTTGIVGTLTSDSFTFNGQTNPHYGINFNPTNTRPIGISGYSGIAFASSGIERMRIHANGYVSIGGSGGLFSGTAENTLSLVHDGHGLGFDYVSSLPRTAGLYTSSSALTETAYGDLNIKARSDYGGFYGIGFFTASSDNTPALRMKITSAGDVTLPTGSLTTTSGIITAGHMIRSDAGHNTARIEAVYDDQANDATNSNILMWVSEPGITYDAGGIGVNIHPEGQYYGRKYNNGYGVYMRFEKQGGHTVFYNTQGTAGSTGGQGTETFRIKQSGAISVGAGNGVAYSSGEKASIINSAASGQGLGIRTVTAAAQCLGLWNSDNGGVRTFINFAVSSGGGGVGSITSTGSTTAYNTTSDYRLKENVDYNFNALERVAQLKPARFNFIADAEHTVDGFLAHEVSDIVPEAVTGVKDEMQEEEYEVTPAELDEYGVVTTQAVMGIREVPKYQGIDQSKLIPLLTKAIQEQQTIIEDLKARIETLENA